MRVLGSTSAIYMHIHGYLYEDRPHPLLSAGTWRAREVPQVRDGEYALYGGADKEAGQTQRRQGEGTEGQTLHGR